MDFSDCFQTGYHFEVSFKKNRERLFLSLNITYILIMKQKNVAQNDGLLCSPADQHNVMNNGVMGKF